MRSRLVPIVFSLLGVGCAFEPPPLPDDALVSCSDAADCLGGQRCVRDADDVGLCVGTGALCVEEGDVPRFAADGAPCGAGTRVCRDRRCVESACGDGLMVAATGERCDDGPFNSDATADACRTDCQPARCGDGFADSDEQCDDGVDNSDVRPDGCRSDCVRARCGDGIVDSGEACDNGGNNSDVQPGACRTGCALPACGDAVRDPGEDCDDGTANDDQTRGACRTTCAAPFCGDGVVDPAEVCDDGNTADGDGCRGDCSKREVCGDQELDEGEGCDEGNDNPRDGCDGCRQRRWLAEVVVGQEAPAPLRQDFNFPRTLTIDRFGRVYIPAQFRDQIYRLDPDDSLTLVAGRGPPDGFGGDGGPATAAALFYPTGAALDASGRLLIADTLNGLVRRVDRDGTITTVVNAGDPTGIVASQRGEVFFTNEFGGRLLKLTDRGEAIVMAAGLQRPQGLAVDTDDTVLVAESGARRVIRVTPDGTVSVVAGTGQPGRGGDGGAAEAAELVAPSAVATGQRTGPEGRRDFYIADAGCHCVRYVDVDGTISTVVGTGAPGEGGDGGPAAAAELNEPTGVVVDARGRLYISDSSNGRIRRVDEQQQISSVAGPLVDPDEEPLSRLAGPAGIAFDAAGRLLVADTNFHRIRRVDPPGRAAGAAVTVAGNGIGFAGDGRDGSDAGPADDHRGSGAPRPATKEELAAAEQEGARDLVETHDGLRPRPSGPGSGRR